MPRNYPPRSRKFSVGKEYYPQSFYLASKHQTKTNAKEKAKSLRAKGFATRIIYHKTAKQYVVYGNSLFGRKKGRHK